MESLIFYGDAFSEYYLTNLMWDEPRLKPLLGTESAQSSYRRAATIISHAQRALRAREQPRSTRTLLLKPLGELLGWALGDEETSETAEGAEDAGTPLISMVRVCSHACGPSHPTPPSTFLRAGCTGASLPP